MYRLHQSPFAGSTFGDLEIERVIVKSIFAVFCSVTLVVMSSKDAGDRSVV